MAADNVTSIEQQVEQARAGYAEAASIYQDNLGALIASGQALVNSCQTMQGTVLAFAQSRAKEGLATGKLLAECGSPSHAAEIQLDFARTTLQAYADQLNQLGDLTRQVLAESFVPFEQQITSVAKTATESVAA